MWHVKHEMCNLVRYGRVWNGTVWDGEIWHGIYSAVASISAPAAEAIAWYGMGWDGMVWDMGWYGTWDMGHGMGPVGLAASAGRFVRRICQAAECSQEKGGGAGRNHTQRVGMEGLTLCEGNSFTRGTW